MEKIKQWDHWILDNVYQRVADWVWDILPVSCFSLARLCLLVTVILINIGGAGIISSIICFVVNYLWITLAQRLTPLKFMNPYREVVVMRILPWFSIFMMVDVSGVFYLSMIYFLSCSPRPPVERRALQGILGVS